MHIARSNSWIRQRFAALVAIVLAVGLVVGGTAVAAGSSNTSTHAIAPVSIEAAVFTAVGNQGADDLVDVIGKATGGRKKGYWPTWEIPGPLRRVLYVENPKKPQSRKVLVINGDGRLPTVSDDYLFNGSLTDLEVWSGLEPVSSITLASTDHQKVAERLVKQFAKHGYAARLLDGEVVGIPSTLFRFVLVTNKLLPSHLIIVRAPETAFPPGFFQPWHRPTATLRASASSSRRAWVRVRGEHVTKKATRLRRARVAR